MADFVDLMRQVRALLKQMEELEDPSDKDGSDGTTAVFVNKLWHEHWVGPDIAEIGRAAAKAERERVLAEVDAALLWAGITGTRRSEIMRRLRAEKSDG